MYYIAEQLHSLSRSEHHELRTATYENAEFVDSTQHHKELHHDLAEFRWIECCKCLFMMLLLLVGYSCFFITMWYLYREYQPSYAIQEMRWILAHLPDGHQNKPSWSQELNQSSRLSELGNQVVPVILRMSNYTKSKKNGEKWNSSYFFTFHGGHQLYLQVNPAGDGEGKDSHISIKLFKVNGLYDQEIDQSGLWRLTGIFNIELLNQQNDTNHYSERISVTDEPEDTSIEVKNSYVLWEESQFISQDSILNHKEQCYFQNDHLFFRIDFKHERYLFHFRFHFMDHFAWSLVGGVLVAIIVYGELGRQENISSFTSYIVFTVKVAISIAVIGNLFGGLIWLILTLTMSLLLQIWLREALGGYAFSFEVSIPLFVLSSLLIRTILLDVLFMPWGLLWRII